MHTYTKASLLAIFLIFCLSFDFLFLFPYHPDTAELTVDDIIEGFEFHASLIKSGKGRYVTEYTTTELGAKMKKEAKEEGVAPPLSRSCDITYYFEGDKFRYNVFTKDIEWFWWNKEGEREVECRTYEEYIYDGETAVSILYQPGSIVAFLTSDPKEFPFTARGLKSWAMELLQKPLGETLRSSKTKLVGVETLNGQSCYVMGVEPLTDIGATFKVWINPGRGYLMQQLEVIPRGSPEPVYVTTNEFKEYPGGIWFISGSTGISYSISEKPRKEIDRTVMKVEEFQINIDIPDDIFKPVFEKGTDVHDRRTGQTYRVE